MSDIKGMDKDARIAELERENAELRELVAEQAKRIEELERRLGMNSDNSSKPPSSDFPPPPQRPPKRRKKRGARKGRRAHLRELLPPERVKERVTLKPAACSCGCEDLEPTAEEPLRHQVVDLPPILPEAVEYVRPILKCRKCGKLVHKALPDEVNRRCFGPGVLAVVAVLTGMVNTSKRKALAMMNEVFNIPMSLGGLSNCEARIAEALEAPWNEAAEAVRAAPVAHADETGWRRGNRERGWLWTLCCASAAAIMVQARRNRKALAKLLGGFCGALVSDRFGAYGFYAGARQLCWAHLKRDFKAMSETKGEMGRIGRELHILAKQLLRIRARVRDGTLHWNTFQQRAAPLAERVETLLAQGAATDATHSRRCKRLVKLKDHLWTFTRDARVEPTNNLAERVVRQGVLWRKGSLGTQSERGARYVERILTVCATRRLQGCSIIVYLREAARCHIDGLPAPSLFDSRPAALAKVA